MNKAGFKTLATAIIAITLTGCASITPSPKCIAIGAATGAVATSGGDSGDIAKGALGGAVIGTLLCMAMDTGHKDDDQDGVINRTDECPATPLGASVNKAGCNIDLDGDGVENALDQCANTPAGTKVDNIGCSLPASLPASESQAKTSETFDEATPIILDGLHFEFDSAKLSETSVKLLLKQFDSLSDSNQLTIDVIGHTDTVGSEEYNKQLSFRRAEAVVNVLRSKGLIKATLNPVGKGESQPLVIGETDFANSKNRRVEVKIRKVE